MLINIQTLSTALRHCAVVSNSCKDCPYDSRCSKTPGINRAMMDASLALVANEMFNEDFTPEGEKRDGK